VNGSTVLRRVLGTTPGSVLAVVAVFVACPAFVMAAAVTLVPALLRVFEWFVATAFLATSIALALESYAASRRIRTPAGPVTPPSLSVVVSAYLPNEQDIIIETLRHVLRCLDVWSPRMQIILVYNTPSTLDVEAVLQQLGRMASQIQPLRVEGSTSKAENIDAALPHLTGEMTLLLDADHHPAPDAPARAWRWLTRGYDIVQGRCVVRNPTENFQSHIVAIEFEQMYAVAHQARSLLVDTAIFGGTNGWWRTSVLREIGMDPRMLTEDIDSATRAILAGYKVIHDRSVISTELSTMSFRAWWNQRLRWAQGWHQVVLMRHQALRQSPHLTNEQRTYWTYMLLWGGVFPVIGMMAVSVLIAAAIVPTARWSFPGDPYLIFTTIVTLGVLVMRTWLTWRVATPITKRIGVKWLVLYAVIAPAYETLKTVVALTAILREAAAMDEWVVTSREHKGGKVTATPTSHTSIAPTAHQGVSVVS
jgi:cellulose synthase/poly-beta-1,6-N-acetylglucosamine synthase-like glycosyltransferase